MSLFAVLFDILFVGHSLVGPNLPDMVEAGLNRQGARLEVAAQVINGAPLKYSWENSAEGEGADARVELLNGKTSVLILTEAIPLAAQIDFNKSADHVALFAGLAWAGRPDTQVYVYETWHSLKSGPGVEIPGDAGSGVAWRDRLTADYPKWEALAAKANAGRPDGAPLVRMIPVGQAMGLMADEIAAGRITGLNKINDLFDDDIHLNGKGLAFAALVHIAAISGKDPTGLPAKLGRSWLNRASVLTDGQAAAFQRIAWAAVTAHRQGEEARLEAQAQAAAAPAQAPPPVVAVAQPAAVPTEVAPQATIIAAVATPVVAPKAAPDQPPGVTNPSLSLGLAGVHDWSVQQPFLDVFKTARPWIAHKPGQWGGWEYADLASGGQLDANGWPLALPPGATGISTLFLTDLPDSAGGVAGRYVLTHKGKGDLQLSGRASVVEAAPGRVVFDYTPGPGSVIVTITAVDVFDPIREIAVVRQDRAAALASGAMFNPDWLARIRGVKAVRFMDWMAINNSVLEKAADRPLPTDFSWGVKGVPLEVMLALANDLQADPWFTIPHRAEDGLVRAYAEAAKSGLAPGLRAHVEYSNEVWNWQFDQSRWADTQAQARWSKTDAWVQYYALRASEVADIWTDVFGDEAEKRLVRVISTQTGWSGLEEQILQAPLVMAEGKPAPATHFDAYAVTGYFAASLGTDEKAPVLRGWLADSASLAAAQADQQGLTGAAKDDYLAAHRFDMATDRAATELENGFVTGQSADTLVDLLGRVLPYHAQVAKKHDLRLMMYEGGTHVVGNGALVDDAELTAFYHHLNYSPQMGDLYDRLQAGWVALTDAPFNAFVDVYNPDKWGSWGALRHLGDDNPRWQSLATGCQGC